LLHNETVQQTGTHNKCEAAGGIIAGTPVKLLAGPAADLNSVSPPWIPGGASRVMPLPPKRVQP
jgi:hypothetical protein